MIKHSRFLLLAALAALIAAAACQRRDLGSERLATIDSLYASGDREGAAAELEYLDEHELAGVTLARYLCLKGAVLDEYENIDSAIYYMKRAERIASGIGCDSVLHEAAIYLSYLHNISGNPNLAIKYAGEAIAISEKHDNRQWRGTDYMQLAGSYYNKGMVDSSDYYTRKSQCFIKYQKRRDLPDMLNNVAVSYLRHGQLDSARLYLRNSLEICPNEHTYYLLAESYQMAGNRDSAEVMWGKAVAGKDPYLRARIETSYADWLRAQGEFQRSADAQARANALKDSLDRIGLGEAALTANSVSERMELEQSERRKVVYYCVLCGLLAIAVLALWIYNRRKSRNEKKLTESADSLQSQLEQMEQQMADLRSEISTLRRQRDQHDLNARELEQLVKGKTRQLNALEQEHAEKDREMRQMQSKLRKIESDIDERIKLGQKLMHDIENGGKASQWNKHQMESFIHYYSITRPECADNIGNNYKPLSPTLAMILVLADMGMDAEAIQNTLGMSTGAYRTAKSRLNSRMKSSSAAPE